MSVECFLDTNVLVYAASSAEGDAAKSRVRQEANKALGGLLGRRRAPERPAATPTGC